MKVLVIDDEPFILELVREFLQSLGHEVETCQSGEEGLARFSAMAPRVVLLDIKMPGMSGLDVLRRIREKDSEVGIIMISAFGGAKTMAEALRLGANNYIEKPMQLHQLMDVMSHWERET